MSPQTPKPPTLPKPNKGKPKQPRRMSPEVKRILDSLPPTFEDQPSKAELEAMDALLDTGGFKLLKGLLHAKVINKDKDDIV